MTYKTVLCFLLILVASLSADAAEIRLYSECRCRDTVVRLGDVADVRDGDAARTHELQSLELFPAPTRAKTLRARELEEILSLAAVDTCKCRFSGAGAVMIYPADQGSTSQTDSQVGSTPAAAPNAASKGLGMSKALLSRARGKLSQALALRLQTLSETKAPWEFKFDLSDSQAQAILAKDAQLAIAGGHEPFKGEQEFAVTVKSSVGQTRFAVQAQVTLPPLVVVASRPLRKGEVVRASDIELQPTSNQVQNAVFRLEDVVGKETIRAVATGQLLEASVVRSPLLVQRGEAVRVIAKASGVRVRTAGRALQDGSQGELVEIQPLDGKQRYMARVVNFQEVEVYAQGPSVEK